MTQVTQTDAKTSELVTYVENRSSGFFLHVVSYSLSSQSRPENLK